MLTAAINDPIGFVLVNCWRRTLILRWASEQRPENNPLVCGKTYVCEDCISVQNTDSPGAWSTFPNFAGAA